MLKILLRHHRNKLLFKIYSNRKQLFYYKKGSSTHILDFHKKQLQEDTYNGSSGERQ